MALEDLPIGCIGKLPFYGDYLVVGVKHATSGAFKEWLHEGSAAAAISLSGEEEPPKDDIELQVPLRILMGLPGSTELLAAVVRPSSGRGDRKFPFAVFAEFPRKAFGRHYAMLPLALTSVWRELDAIWDSLASVASKGAFEEILESLRVPQPLPAKEVRRDYDSQQGEPATALFQRPGTATQAELQTQLSQAVSQLGGKKSPGGLRVGLPVSPDLDAACFDASFWIDLFNRQFFMKKFDPSVVIEGQRDNKNRKILLKFGPLEPVDYADFSVCAGADLPEAEILRPASSQASEAGATETGGGIDSSYGELLRLRLSSKG